ncbi:hypothetical protein MP638_005395 [Amoeboaphelidium occidentale]|nr:hypothetical protein MP638_005395 [Amoeboaphelidium occidentale]
MSRPPSPQNSPKTRKHLPTFARAGSPLVQSYSAEVQPDDCVERECQVYVSLINSLFADNSYLNRNGYVPISDVPSARTSLVQAISKDGVLLAYLMHSIHPHAIEPSGFHATPSAPASNQQWNTKSFTALSTPSEQSGTEHTGRFWFRLLTNFNTLLTKLSLPPFKILSSQGSVSAEQIMDADEVSVLDLVWRLIKALSLKDVSLDVHPELIRLCGLPEFSDGHSSTESCNVTDLISLSNESLLIKWVNYHLAACTSRRVSSFKEFSDCEVLVLLVNRIIPNIDSLALQDILNITITAVEEMDAKTQRHQLLLDILSEHELESFDINAEDLAMGHPRLTLLLLSCLFNSFLGISQLASAEEFYNLQNEYTSLLQSYEYQTEELHNLRLAQKDLEVSYQEELQQRQSELKMKAVQREFQLNAHIEELSKKIIVVQNELNLMQESRDSSNHEVLTETENTLKILHSYFDHKQEIFSDAKDYEISAFDNEGKKMVFRIPTPSIKQKISFSFDEKTGEKRISCVGHEQGDLLEGLNEGYGENDACVGTEQEFLHSCISDKDTRRVFCLERPLSCPPDILLDKVKQETRLSTANSLLLEKASITQRKASLALIPAALRRTGNGAYNEKDEIVDKIKLNVTDIHSLVQGLMQENLKQVQQMQLLAAKVDEMTWLNQVMGEKVREFSEDMMNKNKNGTLKSKKGK